MKQNMPRDWIPPEAGFDIGIPVAMLNKAVLEERLSAR